MAQTPQMFEVLVLRGTEILSESTMIGTRAKVSERAVRNARAAAGIPSNVTLFTKLFPVTAVVGQTVKVAR